MPVDGIFISGGDEMCKKAGRLRKMLRLLKSVAIYKTITKFAFWKPEGFFSRLSAA